MKQTVKNLLACAMALTAITAANAQRQITVSYNDGSADTPFSLTTSTLITFGQGTLNLDGQTIELNKISTITFKGNATGLNTVEARQGQLRIANGQVSMSGLTSATSATLYSASGQTLLQRGGWKGEPIDISALPVGMYILKTQGGTYKFTK